MKLSEIERNWKKLKETEKKLSETEKKPNAKRRKWNKKWCEYSEDNFNSMAHFLNLELIWAWKDQILTKETK